MYALADLKKYIIKNALYMINKQKFYVVYLIT